MPRSSSPTADNCETSRTSGKKLGRSFFAQSAEDVARGLIGKIVVRRVRGRQLRARIVETEAYLGPDDLASHSSKGRTARTEVMFGPPGHAYVYLIYGIHDMLNVVTGVEGEAHAVLIRGATPLDDWDANLSGPGLLARALRITRAMNGHDLTGDRIFFSDDGADPPRIKATKRIGIDYAGKWKHALLRFVDANCAAGRK